jgi:hypothetical protein
MPHEAAIDSRLKSGDIFGARREDRLLNIQRGGSVLKNLNCTSGELFEEQIANL